jgi:cytochrome c oxidase assembly protein Cox11
MVIISCLRKKDWKIMKKFALITTLAMSLMITGVASATVPGEKTYRLVTENYVVQNGDTLDSIARYYINKNTYGAREITEFREGIRELNWDIIGKGDVKSGEVLQINYWIPNDSGKE